MSTLSRLVAGAIGVAITSAPVEPIAVEPAPRPASPASMTSLQEQPLDTDVVAPEQPKPKPKLNPKPNPSVPGPPKNRLVRTPRDEDLPSWVPISGRLTVVSACDLAENLGLAPLGTARSGGCPSVAALLEEERLQRSKEKP